MADTHMSTPTRPRRGTYASLDDIRVLAAIIREQELDLMRPSERPTLMLNGKVYSYNEVTRRIQRAKKRGTWSEESLNTTPQPGRVQIVPSQTSLKQSDVCAADDEDEPLAACSFKQQFCPEKRRDLMIRSHDQQLVLTKDKTSLPIPLSWPDEFRVPQRFCFSIIRYFQGAYDHGLFVNNDAGELVSRSSVQSFTNLTNFHKCCVIAIDLWSRGYYRQGAILLSKALILVEVLLDEQDPKLLDVLCDISILLHTKGMGSLYAILKHKVCNMVEIRARKKNEQRHPWAQIFDCIRRLSDEQVVPTMQRGWKCGYQELDNMLPEDPWDALHISCYSEYPLRIGENVQRHWDTLLTRSVQLQPSHTSDIQRLFACGKILYLQNNYRGALRIMEDILSQCYKARQEGEVRWMLLEVEALEVSARCHFAIHKLAKSPLEMSTAESLLENAIGKSTRICGPGSASTIALQHTLWLWFLEQGRSGEADLLRQVIDSAVGETRASDT